MASKFQVELGSNWSVDCAHFSTPQACRQSTEPQTSKHIPLPLSTTSAATSTGEQDKIDLMIRVPPSRREQRPKHPGADARHVPLSNQALRRRAPQPSTTHSCESSRGSSRTALHERSGRPQPRQTRTCGETKVLSPCSLGLDLPLRQQECRRQPKNCNCSKSTVLAPSGPSPAPVVAHRRARQQPHPRTAPVESSRSCAQFGTVHTCLCGITAMSNTLSKN